MPNFDLKEQYDNTTRETEIKELMLSNDVSNDVLGKAIVSAMRWGITEDNQEKLNIEFFVRALSNNNLDNRITTVSGAKTDAERFQELIGHNLQENDPIQPSHQFYRFLLREYFYSNRQNEDKEPSEQRFYSARHGQYDTYHKEIPLPDGAKEIRAKEVKNPQTPEDYFNDYEYDLQMDAAIEIQKMTRGFLSRKPLPTKVPKNDDPKSKEDEDEDDDKDSVIESESEEDKWLKEFIQSKVDVIKEEKKVALTIAEEEVVNQVFVEVKKGFGDIKSIKDGYEANEDNEDYKNEGFEDEINRQIRSHFANTIKEGLFGGARYRELLNEIEKLKQRVSVLEEQMKKKAEAVEEDKAKANEEKKALQNLINDYKETIKNYENTIEDYKRRIGTLENHDEARVEKIAALEEKDKELKQLIDDLKQQITDEAQKRDEDDKALGDRLDEEAQKRAEEDDKLSKQNKELTRELNSLRESLTKELETLREQQNRLRQNLIQNFNHGIDLLQDRIRDEYYRMGGYDEKENYDEDNKDYRSSNNHRIVPPPIYSSYPQPNFIPYPIPSVGAVDNRLSEEQIKSLNENFDDQFRNLEQAYLLVGDKFDKLKTTEIAQVQAALQTANKALEDLEAKRNADAEEFKERQDELEEQLRKNELTRKQDAQGLRDVVDEMNESLLDLKREKKNSGKTGSRDVNLAELREIIAQGGGSEIMVSTLTAGTGGFELRDNGLVIAKYDGDETVRRFNADVNSAFAAWEQHGAMHGAHDDNSRYTSLTHHKQKSLFTISRLTNRPAAEKEGEIYVITTVDKGGLSQTYVDRNSFENEVERPIAQAHKKRVEVVKDALKVGAIPNLFEALNSSIVVGEDNAAAEARLVKKVHDKARVENIAKAEKAVDIHLNDEYKKIIEKIDAAHKEEKTRLMELLGKGDYKAIRKSLVKDDGSFREELFGANNVVSVAEWNDLNTKRNGNVQPYIDFIAQIKDPDARIRAGKYLEDSRYSDIVNLVKDPAGNVDADLVNRDVADVNNTITVIQNRDLSAVELMQKYEEQNIPEILKVFEREKELLENQVKSRQAAAEIEFERSKYREIIKLMHPGKDELVVMMKGPNGADDVFGMLFEEKTTGSGEYKSKIPGMFGANESAAIAAYESYRGGTSSITVPKEVLTGILDLVDDTRLTKASMLKLMNDGNQAAVADMLFNSDGTLKAPDLFSAVNHAAAEGLFGDLKNNTKKQEHIATYLDARGRGDVFKKINELGGVIGKIKKYEKNVLDGKVFRIDPHNALIEQIATRVLENNLTEQVAEAIVAKASTKYNDSFLEHKLEIANIKNADAIAFSPDEQQTLLDKDSSLKAVLNIKLAAAPLQGISYKKGALNQFGVLFNGDCGDPADPSKPCGLTKDVFYMHVPGSSEAYIRATICTTKNMIQKDGKYYLSVYKNGKEDFEEHNPGDVVIDENTVFHYTEKKNDKGEDIRDAQGKSKMHYKPISLGTYTESASQTGKKLANIVSDLTIVGGLIGAKLNSNTQGENEFGRDAFAKIQKSAKNMQILVMGVGSNGERSCATMVNGKAVSHAIGKRTAQSVVRGRDNTILADRVAFAEDGQRIEFKFDKNGKLHGGKEDVVLVHDGVGGTNESYKGNSVYFRNKHLRLSGNASDIELFGKVSVISGSQNGTEINKRTGDAILSDQIFYKNKDTGEILPLLDSNGNVKQEFKAFYRSVISTNPTAPHVTDEEIAAEILGKERILPASIREGRITESKERIPGIRDRFIESASVSISLQSERISLDKTAVMESDANGWKMEAEEYKSGGLHLKAELYPGIPVLGSTTLKRDLKQIRAAQLLDGVAVNTVVDIDHDQRLRQLNNASEGEDATIPKKRTAQDASAAFFGEKQELPASVFRPVEGTQLGVQNKRGWGIFSKPQRTQ